MPSGATDLKMIFHQLHQYHSHVKRRYSDMFHQNRHIQQVYVIVRQLFTNFNSNIKYIIHPYPELSRTQICQNISRDRRSTNQPCPKRPIYIRDHSQLNFFEQKKHKTSQTYQNTHLKQVSNDIFLPHFPPDFPHPSSIRCAPPGPCHAGGAEEQLGRQERPARAAHGAAPEGAASAAGRGRSDVATRGWWCWWWG